jgi:hypothetical protein
MDRPAVPAGVTRMGEFPLPQRPLDVGINDEPAWIPVTYATDFAVGQMHKVPYIVVVAVGMTASGRSVLANSSRVVCLSCLTATRQRPRVAL